MFYCIIPVSNIYLHIQNCFRLHFFYFKQEIIMKNGGGGGLGIVYVSGKELCEDLRVIVIENLIEGGAYVFNFHLPGVSENIFP